MMDGVHMTSWDVKDHWFGSGTGDCRREARGDCVLEAPCERGGDVRDECWGGVGAAGGTSRRPDGDVEPRS